MATGINDLAGRQKVLEGLWQIGIEPGQLAHIDPKADPNTFLNQLHANGINDDFYRRAVAGVDWRPDSKQPLSQRLMDVLRVSGYRPDEVQRFYDQVVQAGAADDPKSLLQGMTTIFGDRAAGAMVYKATGGKPPDGSAWNPYRTDVPPKNVDTQYGVMGVPSGSAGGGELPIPPPPGKITQQGQPAAPGPGALPPPKKGPAGPGAGGPGAGGPGGGGGAGAGAIAGKRAPGDVDTYLAQNYGHLAYLMSVPEVAKIVKDAEKLGLGDDEIEGRITGTQWWKTTTDSKRLWQDQKITDPATATRSLDAQVQNLRTSAQKYGLQIDDARLRQIAETSLEMGWNTAQADDALSKEFHYQAGQSTAIVGRLKQLAGDYYIPLSDGAIQQWGSSIIAGGGDETMFNQYVKDQAKSMFPTAAGAIDRGVTVKAFTDPYRQIASNTLELDPDTIDFSDPKYLAALSQPDQKTGDNRLMSLSEWSDHIKKDDRYGWDKTENARGEATDMAQKITQIFGGGL